MLLISQFCKKLMASGITNLDAMSVGFHIITSNKQKHLFVETKHHNIKIPYVSAYGAK